MRIDQPFLEQIVWEVIQRLTTNSSAKPNLVLVYPSTATRERIQSITFELQKHWQIEVACCERGLDYDSIPKSTNSSFAFVDVDQDLLARGALGLTDTPISRLLAQALRNANPILLEFESELTEWLDTQMKESQPGTLAPINQSYRSHVQQYKKTLMDHGAWFGRVIDWRPSEKRVNSKLITEQDLIRLAAQDVRELRITAKTILTQLARDTAKEKGIRIRFDEEL